jgi:hypothetical protein
MIKNNYKNVLLIELGYNSSFCKGNNIGIEKAFQLECEAVIFLNNDTKVEENFLTKMVEAIDEEKKIGMVAAKIFLMRDRRHIDSVGIRITPDGLGKNKHFGEEDRYFIKTEVFCPAGAAALYTKKVLEDIKYKGTYFDEDFEFFVEDTDLGFRARLRGWKCMFAPEAIVYHYKSATAGLFSEFMAYHINKNILFNIIKNYPVLLAVKALFLTFLRYLILAFGIFLKKGHGYNINNRIGLLNMIRVTLKGFSMLFLKFPNMIEKRFYIQKNRLVSGSVLKKWFKDEKISVGFFNSVLR